LPWKALNFKEMAKKNEISKKLKITGIPNLVLLEAYTGNIVSLKERNKFLSYSFEDLMDWK
jgi:hypothetical protein